jgi:hypothetical protein
MSFQTSLDAPEDQCSIGFQPVSVAPARQRTLTLKV